jgi:hypothetical protein
MTQTRCTGATCCASLDDGIVVHAASPATTITKLAAIKARRHVGVGRVSLRIEPV